MASPQPTPTKVKVVVNVNAVVSKLIQFLLVKGFLTEGLFLNPLNESQEQELATLKKKIKANSESFEVNIKSPEAVGQALLDYLLLLPDCFFTHAYYDSFILVCRANYATPDP